ncbi:MAG: hypothetical protein KA205_01230 [Acidobacteria bacterium]|nr:hypothetical protein [Acidobacteriota bacterium]
MLALARGGVADALGGHRSTAGTPQTQDRAVSEIQALNDTLEAAPRAASAGTRRADALATLRRRATLLVALMRRDPQQAVHLQLSDVTRTRLQADTNAGPALIESVGQWRGSLEQVAVDASPERPDSDFRLMFVMSAGVNDLDVVFAGAPPARAAGAVVAIAGMRLGDVAVATEWSYAEPVASAAACATTGEQRTAVILVSMPSKPLASAVTTSMMTATFFGASGLSVDLYLREASNGLTSASGDVFGPVTLAADYIGQPAALRDAALQAATALADFTTYSRIVLVVPQSSVGLESGGLGTIGCATITVPTGTTVASTSWLGDASMGDEATRVATAIHEIGHNLGLQHARTADFGDDPAGPVGQLPRPFDGLHEYGDRFSNMGRALGHWAAPHKLQLGWLALGSTAVTVEESGTFSVRPYEELSGGLKAIRVRRGTGNNAWLWIENRQPTGTFDATLTAGAFTGALIHYEDAAWAETALVTNVLKFQPDGTGPLFGMTPLAAGATWTDPYSNLAITPTREGDGALTIAVSYAAPSTCPISLSSGSTQLAADGGAGSVSVAAADDCAWTVTTSAAWLSFTSATSGTGNGVVTFTVAATVTTSDRWSRLAASSAFAVVRQAGLAGNLTLTPPAVNVGAGGSAGEFAVATNAADLAWSASSDVGWISSVFSEPLIPAGNGSVRYIVAQNATASPRTGTVTVGAQTFTVTQAAGSAAQNQLTWTHLTIGDAPIARHSMAVAPFGHSGQAVLFGGTVNSTILSDTWTWTGTAWVQAFPAHSPGTVSRSGAAMAYDDARGRVVLFGGRINSAQYDNATWVWDGSDWTELQPAHRPPSRSNARMAYHAASGKVVLFGGWTDSGALNDTWEWNGSDWTEQVVPLAPPARNDHAMTYDAARREIVMFGGYTLTGPPVWFADTWVWNGSSWQQRITDVSPSPRQAAALAYDPVLGQSILVGGTGGTVVNVTAFNYRYSQETWAWNGAAWQQIFPEVSPFVSYGYGVWFDESHGTLMALVGDALYCAFRGPQVLSLSAGTGSVVLSSYATHAGAGTFHSGVRVTAAVPWTASTSDNWITLSGTTSASTDGSVAFDLAANATGIARTGTIVVNDKRFTVRQGASVLFSDDPLVAGVSSMRAAHIAELRQAIDTVRARYAVAAFAWTDPVLTAGQTSIKAVHLTELRSALNAAYVAAGRVVPVYTRTLVAGSTPITVQDITELRAAIFELWE